MKKILFCIFFISILTNSNAQTAIHDYVVMAFNHRSGEITFTSDHLKRETLTRPKSKDPHSLTLMLVEIKGLEKEGWELVEFYPILFSNGLVHHALMRKTAR